MVNFIVTCLIIALIEVALVLVVMLVKILYEHFRNFREHSKYEIDRKIAIHNFALGDLVCCVDASLGVCPKGLAITDGAPYEIIGCEAVEFDRQMILLRNNLGINNWYDAGWFVPYQGPNPRLEKLSEAYEEIMAASDVMEKVNASSRQDQDL
jgi:hypothetical protein